MEKKGSDLYLADTAGFCWGVKRAVDIAMSTANKSKKAIYTYGPLIHNPQTLIILEKLGINILNDLNDLPRSGTVIVRAHGITLEEREKLGMSGLEIVDATCPKVKRIQKIISKNIKKAQKIYIYGDKDHSEVRGLLGYAANKGIVVDNSNKEILNISGPSILLCQTTVNKKSWEDFTNAVRKKCKDIRVYNTICDATTQRQEELRDILQIVDLMIIIGGKNSANTQRLYNISREYTHNVIHIENPNELDKKQIRGFEKIGVTAGASTPAFVIQNAMELIGDAKKEKKGSILRLSSYFIRYFYLSDIYSSIGIAGLSYMLQGWLGLGKSIFPVFTLFFFFWGLLLMNHLLSTQDRILNNFIKVDFYNRYARPLTIVSLISLSFSILLTYMHNLYSLPVLIFTLLLSYAYQKPLKFLPLKNVKASKDFVFSAAICVISTIFPLLFFNEMNITPNILFPAIFIFFVALIRSLLFDIRDMNRDKIFGKETLPILIGKEKTEAMIYALSVILMAILSYSCLFIEISSACVLLFIPIAYIFLCILLYKKGIVSKGIAYDFLVETIFMAVFISSIFI